MIQNSMLPGKLAFVDVETTGPSPVFDKVIEIGIVIVENGRLKNKFSSLVNPEKHISPFIENLTGITSLELERAPIFYEVKDEIQELLKDALFIAHNVRFDYAFLKHEFSRCNISFSAKQLCTVKLSRNLFPTFRKHDLDSIIDRFGFTCERRHRAFDDAQVLYNFLQKVYGNFSGEKIDLALKKVLKRPSLPPHLNEKDLEVLPEGPGVYMFYGKGSMPLYIGKSINIRERVLSHFSSDAESARQMEMCQQVMRIETIPTSGELGALLKEAMLIKRHQPLFNRKLRESHRFTIARKAKTSEGYFTLKLESIPSITIESLEDILGVFRSQKQAKTFFTYSAKTYNLCNKLMTLEKPTSACFAYHLGWCKGACVDKEDKDEYNERFLQAFEEQRIKQWPFNTPICIREDGMTTSELFVVDNWCVLGELKADEDAENFKYYPSEFDLDTYKILSSYFRSSRNKKNIKLLSSADLNRFISQSTFS